MQPHVDEFIENLQSYATGSYLTDDEKDNWDAPFDPAVLPQLRTIVEDFLDTLDTLGPSATQDDVQGAIRTFIQRTESYNEANEGAVVEPEEQADLTVLISDAVSAGSFDDVDMSSLTTFE